MATGPCIASAQRAKIRRAMRASASGFALLLAQAPACSVAEAAAIETGEVSITFDVDVWAEFGLTPNAWIGSAGDALPVGPHADEDLLDTVGESFANPQAYPVNPVGVTLTPDPRRSSPPTSFTYEATDVATLHATATGDIAFAGISRWSVDPDLGGGQLLFGDYSLAWNGVEGRWELSNHIDFPVATFWIGDPVESAAGDAFSVSGDLIGSAYLNILLDGALGRDFGELTFATSVPEAGSAGSSGVAALVLAGLRRRRSALGRIRRGTSRELV